jgi:hypothetical protein
VKPQLHTDHYGIGAWRNAGASPRDVPLPCRPTSTQHPNLHGFQNSRMLYELRQLAAIALRGRDGDLGTIADAYISAENWVIRYLVADTGRLLDGRRVLISSFALERIYPEAGELKTDLTREHVRRSPPKEESISRCYEGAFNEYYGYPSYWTGGCLWGT